MLQRIDQTLASLASPLHVQHHDLPRLCASITTMGQGAAQAEAPGLALLELPGLLEGCRLKKVQGLLYPVQKATEREPVAPGREMAGLGWLRALWNQWLLDWQTTIVIAMCLALVRQRKLLLQ